MNKIVAGLLGAVLGSSITLIAVAAYQATDKPEQAAEQIHAIDLRTAGPVTSVYSSTREINAALSDTSTHCFNYTRITAGIATAKDGAQCTIEHRPATLLVFADRATVLKWVDSIPAGDSAGNAIVAVIGDNWAVVPRPNSNEQEARAIVRNLKTSLGGFIFDSED